jgi:hypothetical protein
LAVLFFPSDVCVSDALAALGRLERSQSLVATNAVHVLRDAEGALHVIGLRAHSEEDSDAAPVAWFLREMLESSEAATGQDLPRLPGHSALSASFVSELRHNLRRATVCIVLVVSRIDVRAVVAELRRFRGAKLVHGRLTPLPLADAREPAGRARSFQSTGLAW